MVVCWIVCEEAFAIDGMNDVLKVTCYARVKYVRTLSCSGKLSTLFGGRGGFAAIIQQHSTQSKSKEQKQLGLLPTIGFRHAYRGKN